VLFLTFSILKVLKITQMESNITILIIAKIEFSGLHCSEGIKTLELA